MLIHELSFEPITLDRQSEYLSRFSKMPQKASDYSFINLWGWADIYGLRWAWDGPLVWIKQTRGQPCYWAPVGSWEDVEWPGFFDRKPDLDVPITRIPETLLGLWENHLGPGVEVVETKGHWDYLYRATELASLKGNRFHKKRNLVNQFMKKYDFKFVSLGKEWMAPAMQMQENWCVWRDCESNETLNAENQVIEKIFQKWENLEGIFGGGLLVEDQVVAYTVGEKISKNTLLVHFEKGNPDYIGVYQAINQLFIDHFKTGLELINREQDLGDPGLKKAKRSYHPTGYIKKYRLQAV